MQYILSESDEPKAQFTYTKKNIFAFGSLGGTNIWVNLKQKFEFYMLCAHRENLTPGVSLIC